MARASRASTLSRSRAPRSRMRIRAPVGARPAANVAPPMPDPTIRMSTVSELAMGYVVSDPARCLRIEQHCLVEVEGEGVVLADAQLGVSSPSRGELFAGGAGDDKRIRARRLDDLYPSVEGGD